MRKVEKINDSFGGAKSRFLLKPFYFEAEEFVSIVIFETTFS